MHTQSAETQAMAAEFNGLRQRILLQISRGNW
jgi:hypothetical protein